MSLPRYGGPGSGVIDGALPRLSTVRLPPRVRSLLKGMLDYAADELEYKLAQTLDEFEQQLFKQADQPRNVAGQQYCFGSLREVKRGRADIVPRFMMRLEASLSLMRPRVEPCHKTATEHDQEMSLVEDSELEVDSVIREISARAEVRNSLTLYLMGQRFGVLAGAPAFEAEALPIGPRGLCEVMRGACAFLDIPTEHRVLLLRQFDRLVMMALGPFFEMINVYLAQQRVLPNLSFVPVRAKPQVRSDTRDQPSHTQQKVADPSAAALGRMKRTGISHAISGHPANTAPSSQEADPMWPWLSILSTPYKTPVETDPRDVKLFEIIRTLMVGRRNVFDKHPKDPVHVYPVSTDDVESVLDALQHKPIPSVVVGGKLQTRTIDTLKQEIMAQLRRATPNGHMPRLSEHDSDTIDLVGMLFEHIVRDLKPDGISQNLLAKLQVPMLRTALRDAGFFTQRHHPARRLLNSIAETGMHWLDTDDAERGLVEKMQMLVDRVISDFDGGVNLFETLLDDLSHHMQTMARKAEVTERRHVDAARGRERLTLARVHAAEEVAKRLAGHRIPKLLAQFMEQTWADVLALTELRQGVDSALYLKRLDVADQLMRVRTDNAETDSSISPSVVQALRTELEVGLTQVGHHDNDIQAIVAALFDTEEAAKGERAEPASRTDIAMRLKARARLGADISENALGDVSKSKPSDTDKAVIERIRALPFGTWFDFIINQQGARQRRRLSWFSPTTGRCLFVNQRGQRVEERSMLALAREMQSGQARIVEPESEGLIDRAWQTIVSALQHFSGKPSATR